jgi:hypothetical protein
VYENRIMKSVNTVLCRGEMWENGGGGESNQGTL